jgi:CheY-like chemotaxis protein
MVVFVAGETRKEPYEADQEAWEACRGLSRRISLNLNNMLQVVVGNAQLAFLNLRSGDSDGVRQNIQRILDASKSTSHAVKSLQYFARSTPRLVDSEIVDLSAVVRRAVEMSSVARKSLGGLPLHPVTFSLAIRPGCRVNGNSDELLEAARSLIENAAEAMREGGELRVRAFPEGNRVILEVEDSGDGIPTHNLTRIFQPFFSTKGSEASGMGLPASLGIVRSHGGDISVESEIGKGSLFRVELPLASEGGVKQPEGGPDISGVGLSLLVIDDVNPVLTIMSEGLEGEGHQVWTAQSGEAALKILEETPVDAVISDLVMPGMDGWEVGRRVKQWCASQGLAKTPFVILTGWADQARVEKALVEEAGVDALVGKPVSFKELMDVVAGLVASRKDRGR